MPEQFGMSCAEGVTSCTPKGVCNRHLRATTHDSVEAFGASARDEAFGASAVSKTQRRRRCLRIVKDTEEKTCAVNIRSAQRRLPRRSVPADCGPGGGCSIDLAAACRTCEGSSAPESTSCSQGIRLRRQGQEGEEWVQNGG
jgi:hypothetical protein